MIPTPAEGDHKEKEAMTRMDCLMEPLHAAAERHGLGPVLCILEGLQRAHDIELEVCDAGLILKTFIIADGDDMASTWRARRKSSRADITKEKGRRQAWADRGRIPQRQQQQLQQQQRKYSMKNVKRLNQ